MQIIQLYIEGQRVDTFKDESVSITQSIKNIKDVSKVFTEYTKTFSLPASKVNNKIFKHYYNYDILNGYDARVRVSANIELNNLPFKDGYIKLEGVDLKDNKAHTYKITFFGNTVSLKNTIGEDQLSDLDWLNNFSLIYSNTNVETYLTTPTNKTVDGIIYYDPIQVPLVTHTQRLFYNSETGNHEENNVYWHSGGGSNNHGVKYNELKYALKIPLIIKAIEEKYSSIKFSGHFFANSNLPYSDLYMWLHRTKGKITNGQQINNYSYIVTDFNNSIDNYGNGVIVEMSNGSLYFNDPNDLTSLQELRLDITPATTDPYSFKILYDGTEIYDSGIQTTSSSYTLPNVSTDGFGYQVQVFVQNTLTFTELKWTLDFDLDDEGITLEIEPTADVNVQAEFDFNITQQIPKIKILDFLTGLFKMFNLVAYIENDIVIVKPLDVYYQSGTSYDISKYIDVSKSQSNVALPFREIIYKYAGLKTFFASVHDQLFNSEWGSEKYKGDTTNVFSGDIFSYVLPFEHMKFERLIDINNNDTTDVQWGYCVNDTQEPYLDKPILFYINRKTETISFVDEVNSDNDPTNHIDIDNFFVPTNSNQNITTFADQPSINFKAEIDEWEGQQNLNTLFEKYHKNYIASVFNLKNRITKVTAYLPLRILLNYSLADRFVINGNSYKINTVTTNLENGKSELELLNDL